METKKIVISERWRGVPGFMGYYEVSDRGRVRSLHRYRKSHYLKVMRQSINKKGYCQVSFMVNKIKTNLLVHRLVAMAFIGMPPKGKQVAHNDGVKTNNIFTNLRYATPKENIGDDRARH